MKEIEQNPFRILGLPITASAREIEKQINTLETYAEMGKTKSFETDFSFLSSVERTPEVIADAKKKIQLDESKFFQSLFWFWKNNSVDDLALELLSEGEIDKAIEIWEKAVFTRYEKVYRSVPFISDLIRESDAWSNQNDDDHSLDKQGGEYTIERKIETSSSIPVVHAEFGDKTENWSIECEAEWMGGDDNNGFGIIFGRGDDSYFTFEISGNGYYRFGKTVKWNYVELLPWKHFEVIEELDPNHLQIKKIKDTFSFYINGALAGFTISEPLFGSKFGFKVGGKQTIVFRNFHFSRLKQDDRYGRGVVVTNRNLSCVKNLSILFLSQTVEHGILKSHIFDKAVILANKFFSFDQVEVHSKLIAGDRFAYDSKKTLTFYLTTLVDSLKTTLDKTYGVTSSSFIKAFTEFPNGTGNLVKNKFVGKTIQTVNKFIEKAQNGRRAIPGNAVEIGKELIGNVAKNIDHLREVLDDDDFEYQVIADKVANEVVQCGIDYFNTTKDDEPCLPLYQYGLAVAATKQIEKKANENLDSCNEWIKTKVYRFCFFCSMNEPKIISSVDKTMYRVTNRAYRSVEFTYGDVSVPRCEECALIHEQLRSYSTKFFGIIIAAIVIGFVVGAALAPKNYEIAIGLVSAIIPGIIGWMIAKRFITPVDSKGIRKLHAASEYPTIQERLKQGWTFSKPSA